jgi:hypothetical protein
MRKITQHTRILILLLVMSALPLSMCKATTVFEDFTNGDTSGGNIIGSTPIVGTTWVGTDSGATFQYGANSAGNIETTPYSIYTDGSQCAIYSGLTSALGSGKILTVSYNLIDFGANWNTNSGGYAGVSLYTGYTGIAGSGSEEEFIGEPSGANQIGLDGATTGNRVNGNTTVPTMVTFTYVYDTGAWTFTSTGGINLSGTGTAQQAFNAVRIANGGGADIDLNSLVVDISAVATPYFAAVSPANGSYSGSRYNISIEAIDGDPATINTNTVVMQVDGSTVTPVITKSANITTISYSPGSPLSAGTLHTALVTVEDINNNSYTNAWSFTTGYPSLPVTLAGPFTTGGGNDLTIFTAAGEGWLGTNYNKSSSRTLYTRFSMKFNNLNGETGSGGGFGGLHFELSTAADPEQLLVGNNWGSLNWSYDADTGGAADLNITNSTLAVNFDEWHTIVVRTDYVPNASDNVTIYFDPDFTQPEVNQNSQNITLLTTDVTFDNVRLRCGNGTASAEWTNIVVGSLSTDVGFPPASVAQFQDYIPPVSAPSAYVDTPIGVQVVAGSVGISTNSISMNLDGNSVTPAISVSSGIIAVNYQPPSHFVTNSSHTVTVSLTDTNGTPYSTSWSFTVDSYPTLPVTVAGPIDVTGGINYQIFGSTNEWIGGNYLSSSTNTLYTRFSMTFDDVNGDNGQGGGFGGLEYYLGGTEHLLVGKYWGGTNWSIGAGAPNENIPPITPIPPALGSWHTLVVKTVYATNANDRVEVWLDPDFTKTEGNESNWPPLTLSMNNTFDGINLRCGNGSAYAEYTNIVIAATATEVGFPPPAVPAVIGITNSAGVASLSWTSIGTLQQAPAVMGPWTDSANQANPQVMATTNSVTFFRIRQ